MTAGKHWYVAGSHKPGRASSILAPATILAALALLAFTVASLCSGCFNCNVAIFSSRGVQQATDGTNGAQRAGNSTSGGATLTTGLNLSTNDIKAVAEGAARGVGL